MMNRNPISQMRQRNIMGSSSPYQFDFTKPPETPPPTQMGGWRRALMQPPEDLTQQQTQAPEENEGSKFYDEIERIRGSAGPGLSAYREALNQVPTQDQYKPNWLTRVAAGLGGMSAGIREGAGEGIKVAQGLNQSNYRQAMTEYTHRLGTLEEQANLEREDMKTRMDGVYRARELGLKYDEFDAKRKETDRQLTNQSKTADAAMVSAQARATTAAKQDYDYQPVQGGFLVVNKHNPSDRQVIQAATVQDAQNSVAQKNAESTRMNAITNQNQLGIQQQNADANTTNAAANMDRSVLDQRLRPQETAARVANAGAIQPTAQKAARELAEMELKDDPQYAEFFKTKTRFGGLGSTTTPVDQDDFSKEDWAEFQAALAAKIQEIQERKR